jgi:hypothetical protein
MKTKSVYHDGPIEIAKTNSVAPLLLKLTEKYEREMGSTNMPGLQEELLDKLGTLSAIRNNLGLSSDKKKRYPELEVLRIKNAIKTVDGMILHNYLEEARINRRCNPYSDAGARIAYGHLDAKAAAIGELADELEQTCGIWFGKNELKSVAVTKHAKAEKEIIETIKDKRLRDKEMGKMLLCLKRPEDPHSESHYLTEPKPEYYYLASPDVVDSEEGIAEAIQL